MTTVRREREVYAAGDVVERFGRADPIAIRIESAREQPGWRSRRKGNVIRADHPGTAVFFEGLCYEVVAARRDASSRRFLYELAVWDGRFVMAPPREYSRETCEELATAYLERERDTRRSVILQALSPLVSLLPSSDQERVAERFGIDAVRNTMVWSLVTSLLCTIGLATAAWKFANREPSVLLANAPLVAYLLLESLARFAIASSRGAPAGSALVVLPLELARSLRRLFSTRARATDRERTATTRWPPAFAFDASSSDEVDEVVVEGAPHAGRRLVVTSLLPKDHWTLGKTGVRYQDQLWLPVEREEIAGATTPRHRFVLEPLGDGVAITSCIDYHPEEVQELHREGLRRHYEAWVYSLAMLWGALDWPTKECLAAGYDFLPLPSTRLNIVLTGITGALLALGALGPMLTAPDVGGALALLLGAHLLLESILRWRQLERDGRDRGSLLGRLLEPLVRPMLRVGPRPEREPTDQLPR